MILNCPFTSLSFVTTIESTPERNKITGKLKFTVMITPAPIVAANCKLEVTAYITTTFVQVVFSTEHKYPDVVTSVLCSIQITVITVKVEVVALLTHHMWLPVDAGAELKF